MSDNEVDAPPKEWPSIKALFLRSLKPLASLRLTVFLFVLSLVLVFVGTLAQVHDSNQHVTEQFFRSWGIVWVPNNVISIFATKFFSDYVPKNWDLPGAFPFPGGYLLGTVLLLNLLAAHVVRFKISWKRSGILLIHSGLVLMMVGELVAGTLSVEGTMTIFNGESVNFVEDSRNGPELAFVTPLDAKTDDQIVVPAALLRPGAELRDEQLPVAVVVKNYFPNARLVPVAASNDRSSDNPATAGVGLSQRVEELPIGSGVETDSKVETAAAYLTFLDKSGADLGTYLVSRQLRPQKLTVDGREYEVALRLKRTYKPYTIHLNRFQHKKYVGTNEPLDFRSFITLSDPSHNEQRNVEIYMNHPLRYRGESFYQQNFFVGDTATVLQVVRNPGWLIPYLSCFVVTLGMVVHFGIHLQGFRRRRAAL